MKKLIRGTWISSAVAVCLPMAALDASAADVAIVPDGADVWEMTIAPQPPAEKSDAPVLLASYQNEADHAGSVPEPVELSVPAYDEPASRAMTSEPGPTLAPSPASTPSGAIDPAAYWAVYRTIPFIRTEYEANPSYRHEATMELLFGQLRPTVIHRQQGGAGPVSAVGPAPVPPYVYDIYLGQIPTFINRYQPPAIPFGYPLNY